MAYNEEEMDRRNLHRLIAYSDAVYAIVLTLLILEISVPVLKDAGSKEEMLQHLSAMGPKILAFLLSFFIVSNWWAGYFFVFKFVRKTDQVMVWLNNFTLLCICVMPFLTALIGEYPQNSVGVFLFGSVQALNATSMGIMSKYILRKNYEDPLFDLDVIRKLTKYNWATPIVFLLFAGIAFLNTIVSLLVFFGVFLFWAMVIMKIQFKPKV